MVGAAWLCWPEEQRAVRPVSADNSFGQSRLPPRGSELLPDANDYHVRNIANSYIHSLAHLPPPSSYTFPNFSSTMSSPTQNEKEEQIPAASGASSATITPTPAQAPRNPILDEEIETLMIDNFDSFTWNLYQYLCTIGAKVTVVRNDAITLEDLPLLKIRNLIISPGPGHPRTDSGISNDAIRYFAGKVPILGVCMGLECIVDTYGGEIAFAGEIVHGKTSKIKHDGRGSFKDLPQNFPSTRYHSLSANLTTLPDELAITATTQESGVIMGVRHRVFTIEAVQYHPESIMSEAGPALLLNFLGLNGGTWAENPQYGVVDPNAPPAVAEPAPQSKVPTILEKIHAQRLKDVALSKSTPGSTPADVDALLAMHLAPPLISLVPRLKARSPALMAEVKRASPSKGAIALEANAAQQALTYALGGASVISVLTEPTWFKGSLVDMRLARQAVDTLPDRPAILRKDFIVEEYQIAEARLYGADTILLIVAILPEERLRDLYNYSVSLGMEPLVEVNNAAEMKVALDVGAKVIGVNNRNLHDFEVDMGTTTRLAGMCEEREVILCALSGITGPEDVRNYEKQGVRAVLVGEALMRAQNPKAFIRELLDLPTPVAASTTVPPTPLVKICGVRDTETALAAADAGADFIGLVFAPKSKRLVSLSNAAEISAAIRNRRQQQVPLVAEPGVESVEDANSSSSVWFSTHARRLEASSRPLVVGVFQSQPLESILHIVNAAQLDMVQLHGDEPLQWAQHIPVPVIRAFHVGSGPRALADLGRPGLHRFALLDSVVPGEKLSGGSGVTMDLEIAAKIAAGEGEGSGLPIILAGGLNAENIREAVDKVRPWAVDVSGGVESGGVKDLEKIRAFLNAAKKVEVAEVVEVNGHENLES